MKKIYLDFDGCIIDTISIITKMYDEDFSACSDFKYIHPCEVNTWDFTELSCASADYINTYFNQQRFFDKLNYMDWAKEVLDKLKENFEITIVSSGYSPNLIAKDIWIRNNLPFYKFIGVNLKEYKDKSHIDMSGGIFIDDSMSNLVTSKAWFNICFGDVYSWNEEWKGIRCYNWNDVYQLLGGDD